MLEALLEQPGDLVTREELRRRLWTADTFVDFDNSLNQAINRLRVALGDHAERPRFVETVGRRGYRFIAHVSAVIERPDGDSHAAEHATGAPGVSLMRLAALPFRLLKSDPDTDFLAFSLPDAIASSLSGLESLAVRSSLVAARFASDTPDLPAIAAALDVNRVLAGTILRLADRVRVCTHLVDAPHGTLLWTHTAEAPVDDIFQLSDTLVSGIVESLSLPLNVRESRILNSDVSANGKAYELYLRANDLARWPETWTRARDLYLESIRVDAEYAPAWARLGDVYHRVAKYGNDDESRITKLAEESLLRALALNPELTLAHSLYAQLELETGRAQGALLRLLGRAREHRADPQLFVALVWACRYLGLLDASRAAHDQARRLDPTVQTSVAYTFWMSGDYERAIEEAHQDQSFAEGFLLALSGRDAEALDVLEQTRRTWRYGKNQSGEAFFDLAIASLRGETHNVISLSEAILQSRYRDPDGLYYVFLMLVRAGDRPRALTALRHTIGAGFACWPALSDYMRHSLGDDPAFEGLRSEVEQRHRNAGTAFRAAGGQELLHIPTHARTEA